MLWTDVKEIVVRVWNFQLNLVALGTFILLYYIIIQYFTQIHDTD